MSNQWQEDVEWHRVTGLMNEITFYILLGNIAMMISCGRMFVALLDYYSLENTFAVQD